MQTFQIILLLTGGLPNKSMILTVGVVLVVNVNFTGSSISTEKHRGTTITPCFQVKAYLKANTSVICLRKLPSSFIVFTSRLKKKTINAYSIRELKYLVRTNFSPNVINKKRKFFWLHAFLTTKSWGFNADVLRNIYSYLQHD